MVLSLAIFNNLVLTLSSQIGKAQATRMMQDIENLHYYVLSTHFRLPVHQMSNAVNSLSLGWHI